MALLQNRKSQIIIFIIVVISTIAIGSLAVEAHNKDTFKQKENTYLLGILQIILGVVILLVGLVYLFLRQNAKGWAFDAILTTGIVLCCLLLLGSVAIYSIAAESSSKGTQTTNSFGIPVYTLSSEQRKASNDLTWAAVLATVIGLFPIIFVVAETYAETQDIIPQNQHQIATNFFTFLILLIGVCAIFSTLSLTNMTNNLLEEKNYMIALSALTWSIFVGFSFILFYIKYLNGKEGITLAQMIGVENAERTAVDIGFGYYTRMKVIKILTYILIIVLLLVGILSTVVTKHLRDTLTDNITDLTTETISENKAYKYAHIASILALVIVFLLIMTWILYKLSVRAKNQKWVVNLDNIDDVDNTVKVAKAQAELLKLKRDIETNNYKSSNSYNFDLNTNSKNRNEKLKETIEKTIIDNIKGLPDDNNFKKIEIELKKVPSDGIIILNKAINDAKSKLYGSDKANLDIFLKKDSIKTIPIVAEYLRNNSTYNKPKDDDSKYTLANIAAQAAQPSRLRNDTRPPPLPTVSSNLTG